MGFYGSATRDRVVTWEDALKYQLWAMFFDHLARKVAKGDIRTGSALAYLLDLVPSDFEKFKESIRNNPEEHARDFISLSKKIGIPLAEEDTKKIIGAMKAALEITEMLTKGRNMEEVAKILHSAYMSNDPDAVLNRHGIDTQQIRRRVAEILREYDLQELIYQPEHAERKTTEAPATKIITKKEPSVEDLTIETLKGMGIDLKLETGNIAERKANIYSWLKENGLIQVEERDGRKIVRPTEKLYALLGKHGGNVAAAMIKWAAEAGATPEHVEPVAKILATLEEVRQRAKSEDPELAKALEKAMRSKHTVRELYLTLVGEMSLEELSALWENKLSLNLEKLLSQLVKTILSTMEELEKAGLGSLSVPKNWAERLKDGNINAILELATAERFFYSALESVAIRGLPGKGKEIIHLLEEILSRVQGLVPYIKETPEELKSEVRELAGVLALMKDESYLEILEKRLSPLVEKIPETKKVGLFRRESPRRRVEDFTALLFEGNLSWEEAEKKAGELKDYLSDYLSKEEAETLINGIMLPFKARKLLEKYGTAESFLFEYAHARASRMLGIEALIWEATKNNDDFYDSLVKSLAFLPAVEGYEKVPLKKFKKNEEILRSLMNKFD